MVQVIPNWFVSGDDLAAVAPKSLQRHMKLLEDHCICQRMPEDDADFMADGGGVLEYETAEDEPYRLTALADVLHNAEEEKEDWSAQIRSIHYDMPRETADIPAEDTQSISGIPGIVTSCSEATAEATNVAAKETTTTPETISKSQEQMEPTVHHDAKPATATPPTFLIPLQVMIPASIITGDDVAQIAPESCQSPIRYIEDHCICHRMPDHDPASPPSRTRMMMTEYEEEKKSDDDEDMIVEDFERSCILSTQAKAHLFMRNLNARAPLEPPNPKKPGESYFIEEDMMDLLETV